MIEELGSKMNCQVSDISPVLFWDVNKEKLDWEKDARYIIERIAYLGDFKDWLIIREVYGSERIRDVILNMRYLDEKSTNYYAELFRLPLEKFRCYRLRQLNRIPFPF